MRSQYLNNHVFFASPAHRLSRRPLHNHSEANYLPKSLLFAMFGKPFAKQKRYNEKHLYGTLENHKQIEPCTQKASIEMTCWCHGCLLCRNVLGQLNLIRYNKYQASLSLFYLSRLFLLPSTKYLSSKICINSLLRLTFLILYWFPYDTFTLGSPFKIQRAPK